MGSAGGTTEVTIRLRIRRMQPLIGVASVGDGAELNFEGWMGLIGAVADLIGSPDQRWDQALLGEPGEGDEP